jgi:membrane-associated protease RseP (regulator of RpoE activity)
VALDGAEPDRTTTNPAGLALVIALVLAIGIFYSWGAFAFVVGLIVCIFLHELGHYLAAKRAGMKVTQFFLFFGPRVWSFRRGETEYGLRALPLGAFVKVPGMHNLDAEVAPGDEARTYRQAPFHSRFLMAAAGSCMHFAIALALIFVALVAVGKPTNPYAWRIDEVQAGGAAAAAGFQAGDRIVAIDGVRYERFDKVSGYLRSHPGVTATFDVRRGDQVVQLPATITATGEACQPGRLGILIGEGDVGVRRSGALAAVPDTFVEFGRTIGRSFQALGQIFSPSGLSTYGKAITNGCNTDQRMLGPIGAAKAGSRICDGLEGCLALLISANIFIGIVNWFPMLPFDGGHMAIAVYEKLRSRRRRHYADVSKLLPLTYALVAVMLVLFVGNTYLDLRS